MIEIDFHIFGLAQPPNRWFYMILLFGQWVLVWTLRFLDFFTSHETVQQPHSLGRTLVFESPTDPSRNCGKNCAGSKSHLGTFCWSKNGTVYHFMPRWWQFSWSDKPSDFGVSYFPATPWRLRNDPLGSISKSASGWLSNLTCCHQCQNLQWTWSGAEPDWFHQGDMGWTRLERTTPKIGVLKPNIGSYFYTVYGIKPWNPHHFPIFIKYTYIYILHIYIYISMYVCIYIYIHILMHVKLYIIHAPTLLEYLWSFAARMAFWSIWVFPVLSWMIVIVASASTRWPVVHFVCCAMELKDTPWFLKIAMGNSPFVDDLLWFMMIYRT